MTKWYISLLLLYCRFPPGPAPPCPESTPLPPQVVGQVIESLIYLCYFKLYNETKCNLQMYKNILVNLAFRMAN